MTDERLEAIRRRADPCGSDHAARHDARQAQADRAALLVEVDRLRALVGERGAEHRGRMFDAGDAWAAMRGLAEDVHASHGDRGA